MLYLLLGAPAYLKGSDSPLKTTYGFTMFGGEDICLGA